MGDVWLWEKSHGFFVWLKWELSSQGRDSANYETLGTVDSSFSEAESLW